MPLSENDQTPRHERRVAGVDERGAGRRQPRRGEERAAAQLAAPAPRSRRRPTSGVTRAVPLAARCAPSPYQATPQPSGLVSPEVWRRGHSAWCASECGASKSRSRQRDRRAEVGEVAAHQRLTRRARSGSRRRSGGGSGSPSCGTSCAPRVGWVAHEPPRSTLYSGPKNTSEYSRYGNARKPGYGTEVGGGPLPHAAEHPVRARARCTSSAGDPTGAGANRCGPSRQRLARGGRRAVRRDLPLGLGREPRAGPARDRRRPRTSRRAAPARPAGPARCGRSAVAATRRRRRGARTAAPPAPASVRHAQPVVAPDARDRRSRRRRRTARTRALVTGVVSIAERRERRPRARAVRCRRPTARCRCRSRTCRPATSTSARHEWRTRAGAGRSSATVGGGVGEVVHELERREQRLVVLVLVLHDHAVDEPVGEQRIVGVEVDPVEHRERPGAHARRRTRARAARRRGSSASVVRVAGA